MPNPPRRRWSMRAKLLWGANAALAAGLLTFAGVKHHRTRTATTFQQTRMEQPLERARPPVAVASRNPTIPREPFHFSEIPRGNYCTMYARLAAEKMFGIKYERGDAWVFAKNNRSIWKGATARVSDVQAIIQPGNVIGLYNPKSTYNSRERAYTHTALYVGKAEGKHWVMQRIGTSDRLETLEDYLTAHPGWEIREIIAPRK